MVSIVRAEDSWLKNRPKKLDAAVITRIYEARGEVPPPVIAGRPRRYLFLFPEKNFSVETNPLSLP
jgi:hypothetical protein